jgi:hypothetical protein
MLKSKVEFKGKFKNVEKKRRREITR